MLEYRKIFVTVLQTIWQNKYGKRYAIGLAVSGTVLLILAFKNFFIMGCLLLLNILLSIAMRPFKRFYIGVELVTFSTVIAAMVYGSMIGLLFGMVSLLINFFFMKRMTMFTALVLPVYGILGLLVPLFSIIHITPVGIGVSVAYNLIVSFIILAFFQGNPSKCAWFSSTNIAFNSILFAYAAPWFIQVLT